MGVVDQQSSVTALEPFQPGPDAAEGLEASVWADGGRQLCYLPLLLPLMAAGWMWLSNPRRLVINAERMDELGATLAERRHSADR